MLIQAIRAEMIKYKRSPIWLAFLILPLFPAFLGTFNYLGNLSILKDGWYDLWSQHTLFSSTFFLPALFGVFCSFQWRLEHTGHNWNAVLAAPIPIKDLYLSKLLLAIGASILAQACIGVLYLLCGTLTGISAPVPPELAGWLLFGTLGSIAICAVQLLISLVIRPFAIPVGIALLGGIAGMLILSKGGALYFPYSLLCLGMRANSPNMVLPILSFLGSLCIFLILPTLFSIYLLRTWDVQTST